MTSVRLILLVALFSGSAFSAGPAYRHKDPIISQEFENTYRDIRAKSPLSLTEDANASGEHVRFDQIHISTWVSYTPTWAASGTQPAINTGSINGKWRRVGDTMEVQVALIPDGSTTYGTGNYTLSLPAGYTMDADKLPDGAGTDATVLGVAHALDSGTGLFYSPVFYNTTSTVRMLSSAGSQWGQLVPMTWTNGDKMFLKFSAPISGWVAR